MPTTLTLKNIPDAIYDRLKETALKNRRSMNSEAIVCLDLALSTSRLSTEERLARVRALRATLPQGRFEMKAIDAAKREGRA